MVTVLACGLLAGAAWATAGTPAGPVSVDAGRALPEGREAVPNDSGGPSAAAGASVQEAGGRRGSGAAGTSGGEGATAATLRAVRVLRGWDRARAAAYAAGSVRSLRQLYVDGAGEADVRLLRSYVRRGYRVEDLRMQLLSVRVLRHRPGEWSLRVTDRLAGGVAVGYGERVALPRDRADTRTAVLHRDRSGEWRVVRVRG